MGNEVWIVLVGNEVYAVYTTREAAKSCFTEGESYIWEDGKDYSEAYAPNGVRCEVERYEVRGGSCD